MTASLAYRKNEAAILSGYVPDKYTRLLPYIPGKRVLEVGSAEGVLALLLARQGKDVTALEKSDERHESANKLLSQWSKWIAFPGDVHFVNGSIVDRLDLLDGQDTFVAVRMVYYLGADLDRVFAEVADKVPNVVLCGNKNRAMRWLADTPDPPLGEMNRYASAIGMVQLLERHGYRIVERVEEGDPIVVGRMD